jgi:hypothetical protein
MHSQASPLSALISSTVNSFVSSYKTSVSVLSTPHPVVAIKNINATILNPTVIN